jgi:diguanylate cyclase (GGDEF)-like protein
LTGDSAVLMLAMLAIPVVTLSARFSSRGVLIGLAITLGLMIAVALGTNADAVAQNPPLLIVPLAVAVSVAVLSTALMHSDVEHRSKAVIDQLTGLLNRSALEARANELEQQSAITGQPVGLIVADLDGFKQINDAHGHSTGDAVLKEVAYLVRKRLRAFDHAYRLGGDELLVIVPGAELAETEVVAQSLRAAIGAEPLAGGLAVTISYGVCASRRGEAFDFDAVFRSADAALYEAKRGGGDRVGSDRPLTEGAVLG